MSRAIMFSLRGLPRLVPRTFSRSIGLSHTLRPLCQVQKPAFLQSTWTAVSRPAYPAFSTSKGTRDQVGQVDVELAAKFQDELCLETESGNSEKLPKSIQYFLDTGPFQIQDKPGAEEVVMVRTFGDETIRITFTIADLQNLSDEEDFDDNSLQDEIDDVESQSTINQRRSKDDKVEVASEERLAPTDRADLDDSLENEQNEPSYPARVNVIIEKAGKGAMHIETVAQDGIMQIENVSYFENAELANAQTAEKEWSRQSLYTGPPFGNLDEDLQILLERYLDERGIDTTLATFIPEYIDYKEQREYVRWLANLKTFVDA